MFDEENMENDKLIELLWFSTSINKNTIKKMVVEILEFFNESEFEFVKRKHREFKESGYKNDEIYKMINASIENYLFKGKRFSKRKYKRIIYGE